MSGGNTYGSGLHFSGNIIYPTDAVGNFTNGVLDLGVDYHHRFRNLYLFDSVFLSDYDDNGGSHYLGKKYRHGNYILSGLEIENTSLGGNYSQKVHLHTHLTGWVMDED